MDMADYQSLNLFSPLAEASKIIADEYYGEDISQEELVNYAMQGMIASLNDPYAHYYTQEEYLDYVEELNGEYQGIGALIGQPSDDGQTSILKVYDESSAQEAGLQPGDILLSIDNQSVNGLSLEEISSLMQGEEGRVVSILVLRGEEELLFEVPYSSGHITRVHHALFSQYTGYIRIDMFTGNCVEEFSEALRDLTDRGMRSLVIDLRNNPGGQLDAVVSIADSILKEGTIVSVAGKDGTEHTYTSNATCVSVPLAILANENSASASEILIGAVKDHEAGLIVGTKTFGKGIVQTTIPLETNDGWLKLTTAEYHTPNGQSIHGIGIEPDIDVDLADHLKNLSIEQVDQDDDAQLWAALDEVRAQADALEEN